VTSVLVFRNGDGDYAVPIEHCREVRPAAEVIPLPTLEGEVIGVLRWNGMALSVVAPLGPGGAHVIVLDAGGEPFALLVDHVVGIERLDDGSVGEAPRGQGDALIGGTVAAATRSALLFVVDAAAIERRLRR
jgi:chemotaxis signal transduction protein